MSAIIGELVFKRENYHFQFEDFLLQIHKVGSDIDALEATPVVPPKKNRIDPWEYDKELYKRRNEIERFFRRIKRFRRVFTRYDKLDIVFAGFILFAMIVDSLV